MVYRVYRAYRITFYANHRSWRFRVLGLPIRSFVAPFCGSYLESKVQRADGFRFWVYGLLGLGFYRQFKL